MARPRAFDEEKALEAAVACFWARGYEATSVRDLGARMGIAAASLYNAYGDKRALFIQALDHYCNRSTRECVKRIERAHAGRAAIAAVFDDIIARSVIDEDRKGCFVINSAIETAPHDSELRGVIAGYLAEIRAFFRRHVELAQAQGEASASVDAEQVSTHLLGVFVGIRVLARLNPDRKLLEAAVLPALGLLNAEWP